ncbi:fatty-acyl-CoA synthase [Streptomyces spiroverticillatus]
MAGACSGGVGEGARPSWPAISSGTSAHSDGMPVSGVEIAPADSPDEVQPLRVRGPSVCLATGDADGLRLTWEHDDGWYSTGDLIRRLPDGSVRFMSRTAERVGGSFLVPVRDVEAVLDEHPSVDEAVLVGVPDDLGNEQVCAVVTPGSTTPTLDELRAHLTGRGVTDWFQPTLLYVVDAIPRDHLGKPRRGELRDRCTA